MTRPGQSVAPSGRSQSKHGAPHPAASWGPARCGDQSRGSDTWPGQKAVGGRLWDAYCVRRGGLAGRINKLITGRGLTSEAGRREARVRSRAAPRTADGGREPRATQVGQTRARGLCWHCTRRPPAGRLATTRLSFRPETRACWQGWESENNGISGKRFGLPLHDPVKVCTVVLGRARETTTEGREKKKKDFSKQTKRKNMCKTGEKLNARTSLS